MLYIASEIVLFLVGAFALGWWFGHRQQPPGAETAGCRAPDEIRAPGEPGEQDGEFLSWPRSANTVDQ